MDERRSEEPAGTLAQGETHQNTLANVRATVGIAGRNPTGMRGRRRIVVSDDSRFVMCCVRSVQLPSFPPHGMHAAAVAGRTGARHVRCTATASVAVVVEACLLHTCSVSCLSSDAQTGARFVLQAAWATTTCVGWAASAEAAACTLLQAASSGMHECNLFTEKGLLLSADAADDR